MSGAVPDTSPATTLVGRDRERAMLRVQLAAALDGRGSLALIGGEAGIGKTALAEALLGEALAAGALVLVGRCYDLTETPPYGPWAEALSRAPTGAGLPTLPSALLPPGRTGEVLPSQDAIIRLTLAYLTALAASRPLVVLLDDLHWADAASLDLLRVVARGLADLPLLLLATYRADELTRRHPLSRLLPLLEREAGTARLALRPLDPPALGALVGGRYALASGDAVRLVAWLAARADGNPFFTAQLLRALEDEAVLRHDRHTWLLGELAAVGLPLPLRQVIDARVDRLGEAARALLELGAVIGQAVPLALWAAVVGIAEGAFLPVVEAAAEARLLAVGDDGIHAAFAHALIREALYEAVPPTRRRALHRDIAEALASTPGADPDAVAYHYRRAGDPRAVEWLVRAGERAQRAAAALTAAERFEMAGVLLEADEAATAERGWLLVRIANLRRWSDPPLAVALFEEAERLGVAAADRLLAAAAQFCRGEGRSYTGAFRHGLEELAAGLVALEALPPDVLAPLGQLVAAGVVGTGISGGTLIAGLALAGRFVEVRALGARLAAGTPVTAAAGRADEFWHSLAIAAAADGRPDEAHALWTRARANFRAQGNEVMVGSTILWELVWCALRLAR